MAHNALSNDVRLEALIAPWVAQAGFELVRLRRIGGKTPRLQVMAERPDGTMNVDDCAALSRALSEALDQSDPIDGEYVLEVSSPGIDRPLTRAKDFEAWKGHEAKLELGQGIAGRKRFRGVLRGLAGADVKLQTADGEALLPFADIEDARLVLTDALIAEDLKRRKAAQTPAAPDAKTPKEKPDGRRRK